MKLLETVLFYIDFHAPNYAQPVDFRKTIFIFISNTGGKEIIQIARENYFKNVKRSDYDILELQKALANAAFAETGEKENERTNDSHSSIFRWIMACIINQSSFSIVFHSISSIGTNTCSNMYRTILEKRT